MSEERDDALHRYLDDVMDADERAAFEARMAADPALREEVESMRDTGELFQTSMREVTESADLGSFVDGVMAQVEAAPAPVRAAEPAPTPAAPSLGAWERLRAWWGRHWTPVVVSAAAAALVAFVVTRSTGGGVEEGPEVSESGPVIVDAVNQGGNTTVLISNTGEGDEATVIWMLDEEIDDADASLEGEDPI